MYPHLPFGVATRAATERLLEMHRDGTQALDDLESDIAAKVSWVGSGPRIDQDSLLHARATAEALADPHRRVDGSSTTTDQDKVEGEAAVTLYGAVRDSGADTTALDDPGFWRYVGLAHSWNFAAWRETSGFAVKPGENGALVASRTLGNYVDGRRFHECVPLRMYLRVRSLGGASYADLASAVRQGTDFWRSHILRVVAGEHPPIVRAMVKLQADEKTRLNTDPLREFAKQLNRTLVNLAPALFDDDAADALVRELWDRQRT